MKFSHTPILLNEVIEGLKIKSNGVYVDGTIGGAGHGSEILKRLETGYLIGIDQDKDALEAANRRLKSISNNYILIHNNYNNFDKILNSLSIEKVDGVLLDIGVSSYQIDTAERGFSYRFNGPLDMRMDQSTELTAADILNTYSEDALKKIFLEYGEERWGSRIAKFIVDYRQNKTIETTYELVDIIKAAIPAGARRRGPHPAKKTFQALRIEVNDELNILKQSIDTIVSRLNKNGRLAIITFHSLEDRIVKQSFNYLYSDCICPPEFPICTCNKQREINIITRKPITPTKEECENNHRAHSAKLRIAEKL